MQIVIYTLTRDRLWSTRHCLPLLREKAGVEFYHIVWDNGSTDGTVDWLKKEYQPDRLLLSPKNVGISRASNAVLDLVTSDPKLKDALIIKVDNDCEVISDNIVAEVLDYYTALGNLGTDMVLSPRVEGIVRQPRRARFKTLAGKQLGITGIVGGIFQITPYTLASIYRFPETLPFAWGQDDHFCHWVRCNVGGEVGYIEDLVVNHYCTTDGQVKQDPAYQERKLDEMRLVPAA